MLVTRVTVAGLMTSACGALYLRRIDDNGLNLWHRRWHHVRIALTVGTIVITVS